MKKGILLIAFYFSAFFFTGWTIHVISDYITDYRAGKSLVIEQGNHTGSEMGTSALYKDLLFNIMFNKN